MTPLAFTVDPSVWIVIGVFLVSFVAIAFGFFSLGGSEIDEHPSDGRGAAPGSAGPSEASGLGRLAEATDGERVGRSAFSSRGTG